MITGADTSMQLIQRAPAASLHIEEWHHGGLNGPLAMSDDVLVFYG